MHGAAARVDHDVGRAPADVEQHDADVLFFGEQRRGGRGQRFEDYSGGLEPGPVHALEHVGDERIAAGDDVRVDLEPRPRHAHGIGHAVVSVDSEVTRQGVNDLALRADVDQFGGVDDAPHVGACDLALVAGDRDHAAVIRALDVFAGHADVHVRDVQAGHSFGPLGRSLDGAHRLLEVGDHALAQS